MVETGVSGFRMEKGFDCGIGRVEVRWFRVEGRDTRGDAETSCRDVGREKKNSLFLPV